MASRSNWVFCCILFLVLLAFAAPSPTSQPLKSGPVLIAIDPPVPLEQSAAVLRSDAGSFDLVAGAAEYLRLPDAPPEIQAIVDLITPSSFGNHVIMLSSTIGSRPSGSANNARAVDYIASFLQDEVGLETSLHEFGPLGPNVVGVLPTGNATNDAVIVVGAHLDSVGNAPGADDDASGVAAVLEIAHAMAQYQYGYTLIFVAFNAEENGLVGSGAYAKMLRDQNVTVTVAYNFDMIIWEDIGAPADEKIDILHNGGTSEAFALQAAGLGQSWLGAPVKAQYNPSSQSDQASFWAQGYPGIWFFENGGYHNPYWHTLLDSAANPEYSYAQGCIAATTAAAALADFAGIVSIKPGFPTTDFVSPMPGSYVAPAPQVPIVLSIEDSYDDVDCVELSINGGDWFDASAGLSGGFCTYQWNATAAYGPVSVEARVYDAAGWIARASEHFVVDRGVKCQLVAPSPGATISQGTQYPIRANASDLDGRPLTSVMVNVNASGWNTMMPSGPGQYAYNWTVTGWGPVTIQARAIDGNGRGNSSQVTATVARYVPVVSAVSWTPLQPTEVDRIRFTAQVFQDPHGSPVRLVLVFYSVNGESAWAARLMTTTSATGYVATLDPLPAGSTIRLYVQAVDDLGNIGRDDNGGRYYGFTVVMNPVRLLFVAGGAVVIGITLAGSWLTLRGGRRRPRSPARQRSAS